MKLSVSLGSKHQDLLSYLTNTHFLLVIWGMVMEFQVSLLDPGMFTTQKRGTTVILLTSWG